MWKIPRATSSEVAEFGYCRTSDSNTAIEDPVLIPGPSVHEERPGAKPQFYFREQFPGRLKNHPIYRLSAVSSWELAIEDQRAYNVSSSESVDGIGIQPGTADQNREC